MLPVLLRPSATSKEQKLWDSLDASVRRRIEDISAEMVSVAAVLARVSYREQLTALVDSTVPHFIRLKTDLWLALPSSLQTDADFFGHLYSELRKLVSESKGILSNEQKEFLVKQIDNLESLAYAYLEAPPERQSRLVDIAIEFSAPFERADLCLTAILGVLVGEITDSDRGSLVLLCEAVDDYLDDVELVILRHDPQFQGRLGNTGETMTLEEVRRSFDLSGRMD